MVSLLPPGVAHDGQAATTRGFSKRVVYLEPSVLGDRLIGQVIDQPSIDDPGLRSKVSALHRLLDDSEDA